ncbi:hypothetical protein ACIOEZ_34215 [Streptomyces sp. NPDC087866]|uniref:hypothetical protein n=1 Tax=Streptomyces sp. NPDC087866 TaxID=3365815 RepID=UPI0038117148
MDDEVLSAADDYWRHIKEGGDPVAGMRQVAHVYGRSTARKLGKGDPDLMPVSLGPSEMARYQMVLRTAWRQYANSNRTTEQ